MDRRTFIAMLGVNMLPASIAAEAQQTGKLHRIGYLGNSETGSAFTLRTAFLDELRRLGWIEGQNIVIDYRWANGRLDRFPELASELIRLHVEVIFAGGGGPATRAARQVTENIPIVMVATADPVKFGLVKSFARPGGNVTGVALPIIDWGKWLEFARQAVPGASRVAIIANPGNPTYADYVAQNESAAQRLGVRLQMLPVARLEELPTAFAAMKRERASVLVVGPDALYSQRIKEVIDQAFTNRLPVIAAFREAAEVGALISYGADYRHMWRRGAGYVDKILNGAQPAELPVEQPAQYELVINLKSAKALGLTIAQTLLLRADQVIE
jgi:putative tryptophan/tyrosine transport system substrate-binding protein